MSDAVPRDPGGRDGVDDHDHAGRPILTVPSMVMDMELAAQALTQPFAPLDQISVGYETCVRRRRGCSPGEGSASP